MTVSSNGEQLDPVFVHARREAFVILGLFCAAFVWTVSWCYLAGYDYPAGEPVATVLGIPSWALWGIAMPWLVVDVFTVWFCLRSMKDDPLEDISPDARTKLSSTQTVETDEPNV